MAKLRYDQVEKALRKRIAPVYLVTGDEALIVQETCDTIRRCATQQGFSERELYHTDAGFQWEQLTESANSLSLFAEKKIIEIRVHNGKPGDSGSKAIVQYCKDAPDDTLLLLVLPKIDKRSQSSKWFKAIEQCGEVIVIWPISLSQLPMWVEQRLNGAGMHASRDAIDILCAKVEGNLLAAVQEIEKLKLVAQEQTIDASTMADAVTDSARYDVFTMVDKALSGDSRAAVTSLNGLRAEGSEPTLILWALSREIRTLVAIKEGVENGKSFDLMAKQNGVWDKRKALINGAMQRIALKRLYMLIRKAGNTDKTIKGLLRGDAWSALLDIVLSLSGTEALNAKSLKLTMQTTR